MRHLLKLLACMLVLSIAPSMAHEMKVKVLVNGKVVKKKVDFTGWKGGAEGKTDCCDNRHCRPALAYTQRSDKSWVFLVEVNPGIAGSPQERVIVPDAEVTKDNPAEDSNAYWCGDFFLKQDKKWGATNRCAFVPKHQG